MIADSEALLRHYDPEDATVDGNMELGDLSRGVSREIRADRWATYKFDAEGRAIELRPFNNEAQARRTALSENLEIRQVAGDHWSTTKG